MLNDYSAEFALPLMYGAKSITKRYLPENNMSDHADRDIDLSTVIH